MQKEKNKKVTDIISYIIIFIFLVLILTFVSRYQQNKQKQEKNIVTSETSVTTSSTSELIEGIFDPTKLQMIILKVGTGDIASKKGDILTVNYIGKLKDGTVFDSSEKHGAPFTFTLGKGEVIPAWDLSLEEMKVGEIRKLIVPPEYAYGEKGIPGIIPPNSVLIFEVELINITSNQNNQ